MATLATPLARRCFSSTPKSGIRQVTNGVWTSIESASASSSSANFIRKSIVTPSLIVGSTTSSIATPFSSINTAKRFFASTTKDQKRDFTAVASAEPTGTASSSPPPPPTKKREKKAIMEVTGTAADRVSELMEIQECKGIRVSLRQRGCSGMSYVMDFQKDEPAKFDEVLDFVDSAGKKGQVFVDAQAVLFLVGTEMDYVEVEMGSEFVFRNPNEKGTCGCGQSFNV